MKNYWIAVAIATVYGLGLAVIIVIAALRLLKPLGVF